MPVVQPEQGRAPAVSPQTLKRWLDQGHDDAGRTVVLLDTRNQFEVDVGTFLMPLVMVLKNLLNFHKPSLNIVLIFMIKRSFLFVLVVFAVKKQLFICAA